jgi:glutaconate CoA-transferase subunit B
MVDYVFLGGAQIDPYGNLNSTVIGDYDRPKARLPGSGGAADLATGAWRTLVITLHDRRRFVPKLDFLTTPGYLTGKGAREAAGLPEGTGPYKIITNLAVLGFDSETRRMRIDSVHPGVTVDRVRENTGFDLEIAPDVGETEPPTADQIRILREEVDPLRLIIGR